MEELPARAAPRGPRHVRRAVRRGPVPHRRLHLLGARRPVRGDPDEHPPRGARGGPRGTPREPGAPVIGPLPTGRAMRREADMNRGRHVAGHLTGWVLDLLPARDGMEIWFRTAAGGTGALFAPF